MKIQSLFWIFTVFCSAALKAALKQSLALCYAEVAIKAYLSESVLARIELNIICTRCQIAYIRSAVCKRLTNFQFICIERTGAINDGLIFVCNAILKMAGTGVVIPFDIVCL